MRDDDAQYVCTCVGSVKSYRRKTIEVFTKMARKVEIKSSPEMRKVDACSVSVFGFVVSG